MLSMQIKHKVVLCAIALPILFGADISYAASPEDAIAKCDALASDPHDPDRYAAPVADEQFAPGAAIEACKAAVDANPDFARGWFELGRAYWIGEHDTEAFAAFVRAAKRNYAPAMKYIGDAYNEGRGLPDGEAQSIETAVIWYQKASDAGLRYATKALEDAKLTLASNRFDGSIFQNPSYMSVLYSGDFSKIDYPILFLAYVRAFSDELGGNNVYMTNQSCKGMVTALGNTVNSVQTLMAYLSTLSEDNGIGKVVLNSILGDTFYHDMGERDANILVDRYKCNTPITKTIVANAIGSYQKLPAIINASLGQKKTDIKGDPARIASARLGTPVAASMVFPMEERDIPVACTGKTAAPCDAAIKEYQSGEYGAIKCAYYDKQADHTWYYFFWNKKVPYSNEMLAKKDPRAAIRALGVVPVQACPATQDQAEAIYQQNDN